MFCFEINKAICDSHYILSMVYDTQCSESSQSFTIILLTLMPQIKSCA